MYGPASHTERCVISKGCSEHDAHLAPYIAKRSKEEPSIAKADAFPCPSARSSSSLTSILFQRSFQGPFHRRTSCFTARSIHKTSGSALAEHIHIFLFPGRIWKAVCREYEERENINKYTPHEERETLNLRRVTIPIFKRSNSSKISALQWDSIAGWTTSSPSLYLQIQTTASKR